MSYKYKLGGINMLNNNVRAQSIMQAIKKGEIISAKGKFDLISAGKRGDITVVNDDFGAKELVITNYIFEKLQCPDTVKISFGDRFMLISNKYPVNANSFDVKFKPFGGVICSSELVKEIIGKFGDGYFKNNIYTSFNNVQIVYLYGTPAVLFKV
jgi:hypothetical protein